ncbi:MAG: flagellar basal body P-ring formation chaperone FlgA [Planctomycetota bacterium]
MMLLATLTLLAAGDVTVELPSNATAVGLEISVAEICEVKGADAETIARVGRASLGYAPAPGYHRTLRAGLVEASLRQSLPGIDITVTGAPRCRVVSATETVGGERIRAEATKAVRASLIGLDAEAKPEGSFPDLEVPHGEGAVEIRVPLDSTRVVPGLRTVPVEVWVGGNLYRTLHTTFRVSVWKRTAVLRRAVHPGEELHPGLFEEKRTPVGDAGGLHALRRDELIGAIALEPLAAGAAVFESDVRREVVVHRGDPVTVRIVRGPVSVTDVGVAAADGRMGERVAVVLRSTGRELVAVVRGRQTLEVKIR